MAPPLVQPLIEAARELELSVQASENGDLLNVAAMCDSLRTMRRAKLSPAFNLTPRKLLGPRVDVSRSRYAKSVTTTFWPEDGLEANRYPILCGVLAGKAMFPSEDYALHANAGSLIFIPPGVAHCDGSAPHLSSHTESDFCDLFWLYRWEGGLLCHICHSQANIHSYDLNASESCFLIGSLSLFYFDLLAKTMAARLEAKMAGAPVAADAVALPYLVPALLAIVGSDLRSGHFVQPVADARPDSKVDIARTAGVAPGGEEVDKWKDDFGAILQVHRYVLLHLDQALTIDRMAEMTLMSRAQFTRRFRLASGRSFVEWVTHARLERAKLYLVDTDWNVEVIARAVGMQPAHLWNLFARRFNTTPGEYRRQARQPGTQKGAVAAKPAPKSRPRRK